MNQCRRYAGGQLHKIEIIRLQRSLEGLEIFAAFRNKSAIFQLLVHNHPGHTHEQGQVGTWAVLQKQVGVLGQGDLVGIGDDEFGPVHDRPPDASGDHRMVG